MNQLFSTIEGAMRNYIEEYGEEAIIPKNASDLNIADLNLIHANLARFAHSQHHPAWFMLELIETQIINVLSSMEYRSSFDLLLAEWRTVHNPAKREVLAKLIYNSLLYESDIEKLLAYKLKTFHFIAGYHNNPAAEAVTKRLSEEVCKILSTISDIEKLRNYWQECDDNTSRKIDKRFSEIALEKLSVTNDLIEVMSYRGRFGKAVEDFLQHTEKVFQDKIDELVPSVLDATIEADQMYPYVCLLQKYSCFDSLISKFFALVPGFLEKNKSFKTAVVWHKHCCELPQWENIFIRLISTEEDCYFLEEVAKDKNFEKFKQLFENRIVEIISGLKKATPFFMDCIWNRSFFGNKDLFFKKTSELVK